MGNSETTGKEEELLFFLWQENNKLTEINMITNVINNAQFTKKFNSKRAVSLDIPIKK